MRNPTYQRVISQWQHGQDEPEEFITEFSSRDQIPVVQLFLTETHSDYEQPLSLYSSENPELLEGVMFAHSPV